MISIFYRASIQVCDLYITLWLPSAISIDWDSRIYFYITSKKDEVESKGGSRIWIIPNSALGKPLVATTS